MADPTLIHGAVGGSRSLGERWGQIVIPSPLMVLPGGAADPGRDTSNGLLQFDASTNESIPLLFELDGKWKEGSSIKPYVCWRKSSNATGNVYWTLSYRVTAPGAVVTSNTNIFAYTTDVSDGDTLDQEARTLLPGISMVGYTQGVKILCVLTRNAASGLDTYGADAELISVGLNYQINSIGSFGEHSKDGT